MLKQFAVFSFTYPNQATLPNFHFALTCLTVGVHYTGIQTYENIEHLKKLQRSTEKSITNCARILLSTSCNILSHFFFFFKPMNIEMETNVHKMKMQQNFHKMANGNNFSFLKMYICALVYRTCVWERMEVNECMKIVFLSLKAKPIHIKNTPLGNCKKE